MWKLHSYIFFHVYSVSPCCDFELSLYFCSTWEAFVFMGRVLDFSVWWGCLFYTKQLFRKVTSEVKVFWVGLKPAFHVDTKGSLLFV